MNRRTEAEGDWQASERQFFDNTKTILAQPEIGNALEELAKLAERLETQGIPAWQVSNAFNEQLRKSRFFELVSESNGTSPKG